jgi:ribosomal protein L36
MSTVKKVVLVACAVSGLAILASAKMRVADAQIVDRNGVISVRTWSSVKTIVVKTKRRWSIWITISPLLMACILCIPIHRMRLPTSIGLATL